uniref:Uncharacterized protein n=1 Tax=Rhizophora mucronata TaxID=61149 RepID=A0A2P2PSI7_RHIMU
MQGSQCLHAVQCYSATGFKHISLVKCHSYIFYDFAIYYAPCC